MERRKRKITTMGVLRLLSDYTDYFFALDRLSVYRKIYAPKYFDLEDYFPSEVERVVNRLVRKGWAEIKETGQGKVVILTENGKQQKLEFDLDYLKEKKGKWDGKWRVVFFDVEEQKRRKRNGLRKYLSKLGFREMQKSVYVSPYDCEREVKYIREVLNVPHGVKLGILEKIENEEDLKKWFKL